MTPYETVCRRVAMALRDASDEPGAILEAVAEALEATAACVVRAHGPRVVAEGVWRAEDRWEHNAMAVDGLEASRFETLDRSTALGVGAEALSLPSGGEWTCSRSVASPTLVGVRDAALPVAGQAVAGLATAVDILAEREADSVSSRLSALLSERARIASVVHEGVSQDLATMSVQLEVLLQLLSETPQVYELGSLILASSRRAIASIRESILDLTPAVPDTMSLSDGLRSVVAGIARRWALRVPFEVAGRPRPVDPEAMELSYAFTQEALTNLRKHSTAHTGTVRLVFDDRGMSLTVRNEGGTDDAPPMDSTGQGLQLMKGRARLLGGDVHVTAANGGREVMLRLPL